MKDNHLARTCTRTAFQQDGVYNWLRRAGGPYLVTFNEGEPLGKHLHEDGVFNWLRRAGSPYLMAFNEGDPPGKHLHEHGVFNWLRIAGGP